MRTVIQMAPPGRPGLIALKEAWMYLAKEYGIRDFTDKALTTED